MNPRFAYQLIAAAVVMLLLGFILPFSMMIGVLPSTFLLNFFSFAVSVAGLFTGIIALSMLVSNYRNRRDE
ncbi:MAG: hypothetical protein N2117_09300 [Anaerolineales bacterium]|nr:hypothetical protein [Anaerolineales bacterium]MCX7755425.1 hypothetical protein [Anaerolineales bacterium]MDW8279008.1 hypothetical protein [Anaerolineales bacterium]